MKKNNVTTISDQFIKKIYDSGNWSVISFFAIVILLQFNGSFIVYSSAFTSALITFQCQPNETSQSYSIERDSCYMRDENTNISTRCSNNFTFLPSENFVRTSIISHFQLVCDRENWDEIAQSLVIAGFVVGGFIGPITGDYFGRQKVMITSTFLCGILGVMVAFSPTFVIFAMGKCILGILREISMTSGLVLALEFIPSHKQSFFGMIYQLVWCFSIVAIGILSFIFRDWQYLQIVGSCPSLFAPILIIFISESPRWLISQGRTTDLKLVIKRYIKKWNNIKSFEFEELLARLENNKEIVVLLPDSHSKNEVKMIKQYNALDIFRSKYLLSWTLILICTWIYGTTAAFSLNSMTTLVAGNPYLNYCLSALLDAVGVIMAFFVVKISRNVAVLSFQIISAVSFLVAGFLPESLKYFTTCLIILGKMSLNGNLFVINISALYIYPSSLRIFGATISVTIGKLIAIGSPYFVGIFKVKMWIPTTIFGSCALLVGILNIFFPDWLNRPLPETIEDVEILKNNIYLPCCQTKTRNDHSLISNL